MSLSQIQFNFVRTKPVAVAFVVGELQKLWKKVFALFNKAARDDSGHWHRPPMRLISDGDGSIKSAAVSVFGPLCVHVPCGWHLKRTASQRFGRVFGEKLGSVEHAIGMLFETGVQFVIATKTRALI